MNNSIVVKELSKSYGGKKVLDNICIELSGKSITCIMGESGSGKTTLVRILLGLEKADSGTVSGLPKRIAAVFQEDRLCEEFSAAVNVRIATGKSRTEINECLSALGLSGHTEKPVRELSGGMKRRVSIARALLFDAEFIIFDEPFKGLDDETRKNVIRYILDKTSGKTLLFVTHSAEEAKMLGADTIRIK